MELDLGQVRAFVEVARQLHFGRAAGRLFLTQQAVSKRIQRLERTIGEPLFARGPRGVELTMVGQRFLPSAQQLVTAADAAASAARPNVWPLRLDVWGQMQAPLRMIGRMLEQAPELSMRLSMRRSLTAALEAISHGELDACFGRVHDLDRPWPTGVARRPALVERYAVALSADHPLAGAGLLKPEELAGVSMWCAASGSPPEVRGWWRRIAAQLGVPVEEGGYNLGLESAIEQLRRHPAWFALFGADWTIPAGAGVRLIPLEPAPCYLWSLAWPEANPHPLVPQVLEQITLLGRTGGWLSYDPGRDVLPDIDLADLRRSGAARPPGRP